MEFKEFKEILKKSIQRGEKLPWYDENGNKHYANTIEDLWDVR